jgi:hypothetical protein
VLENSVEEVIAIGAKIVKTRCVEKVAFDWFVESALGGGVWRRINDKTETNYRVNTSSKP